MHTILLVEDDVSAIALMEAILEPHADWRLVVASSGDDAFGVALHERPAVVFLDVMLPGIDGIEICRRIKSNPATADTAVVFLTGMATQSTEAEARAAGADDYLVKPVGTAKLVETIASKLAAA